MRRRTRPATPTTRRRGTFPRSPRGPRSLSSARARPSHRPWTSSGGTSPPQWPPERPSTSEKGETMGTATRTLEQLVGEFIEFVETGTPPPELFADDVFVDFTMPRWRLQAGDRD